MTRNLQVYFDLGEYEENLNLESFLIDEGSEVKNDKGNYYEISVKNDKYITNEIYLEMSLGSWTANASFEIPVTQESIGELQKAIASGNAKLKLGEYEYFSTKEQNVDIFDEDYLNFYGN